MSYLSFLTAWYNLVFLLAIGAGFLLAVIRRGRAPSFGPGGSDAPGFSVTAALLVAGLTGLTLNGALHDFRIGAYGRWFPLVALAAAVVGGITGASVPRIRRRVFPPVTGVTYNRDDLEGREAVVLSTVIEPGDVGKARYRDAADVVHVVKIRLESGTGPGGEGGRRVRFGSRVRLGRFDRSLQLYPATRSP